MAPTQTSIVAIVLGVLCTLATHTEAKQVACKGDCVSTWKKCHDGKDFQPCCFPEDTCMLKGGERGKQHAVCRPEHKKIEKNWSQSLEITCKSGGSSGGSTTKSKSVNRDGIVPGVTGPLVDEGNKSHGMSCPASNVKFCARKTKCCASSRMPFTNCCEPGSECVRKNNRYAACLTPEKKALKMAGDNGRSAKWEGLVLKCGQDVAFDEK